jgi:hypothetical protein
MAHKKHFLLMGTHFSFFIKNGGQDFKLISLNLATGPQKTIFQVSLKTGLGFQIEKP